MKTQNAGIVAGLMLALTAVAHSQDGRDRRLVIQEDTVLPIVMNDSLSIRDAQRGDRFTARIDGERRLDGARLLGRVVNVRRESRNRPAALELEFYELSLPSGGKVAVRAVPVRLNDTRDRGGSWSAKKPDNRKQNTVIGGLLGGALIGSMISRAGQGAAIGAVAGILIAESGGREDKDRVISRGTKLGALFQRDVRFSAANDEGERWQDENDRPRDSDDAEIRFDGRALRFDTAPFRQGSRWMVPLESAARQLDLDYDRSESGRIYVDGEEGRLRLDLRQNQLRVNGRNVDLDGRVAQRRNETFVSLDLLAQLTRRNITVNGERLNRER